MKLCVCQCNYNLWQLNNPLGLYTGYVSGDLKENRCSAVYKNRDIALKQLTHLFSDIENRTGNRKVQMSTEKSRQFYRIIKTQVSKWYKKLMDTPWHNWDMLFVAVVCGSWSLKSTIHQWDWKMSYNHKSLTFWVSLLQFCWPRR